MTFFLVVVLVSDYQMFMGGVKKEYNSEVILALVKSCSVVSDSLRPHGL